jgi:hypothetical protein
VKKSGRVLAVIVSLCVLAGAGHADAQTLPTGWSTADVGAVGAAGSASGSGSSFTVSGAGADIWGSADAFRYAWLSLSGDGSIVAQVKTLQYVADWTKAGVMMRASLSPGSQQAMMLVSANKGLAFQRRVTAGGLSTHTSGGSGKAPYFVKLTRSGHTFTASRSTDGTSWTVVGSETIAMPSTIYMGLAVSSHVTSTVATATFASVAATGDTTPASTVETLIFMRHGEKPSGGYGQITCQGLRRALQLPGVLTSRYGTPDVIFAPNPVPKVTDTAGAFYYVRPLATIEPTAISLGMPVNAKYGFTDVAGLQSELLGSSYASATVFIAWEHLKLVEVVQDILDAYGAGVTVPAWPSTDFDSLYVVRITNSGGVVRAQFQHDYQGLDNLPTSCPG